jgi:hypothetical protein
MLRFIVAGIVEAHREGAHRPLGLLLHQRHDQRAIDTAGEEGAQWHIGQHLFLYRMRQRTFHFADRRLGVGEWFISHGGTRGGFCRPPALRRWQHPGLHIGYRKRQHGTRRQLGDALEDAGFDPCQVF